MKTNPKQGRLLISLGLLMVLLSFSLIVYNIYIDRQAERMARQVIAELDEHLSPNTPPETCAEITPLPDDEPFETEEIEIEIEIPDYVLNPEMEMPTKTIHGTDYIGILTIPFLELELPIIGEWSYSNLKNAPCRYSGSAYSDNLVIAGHNFYSHFGGLKNLRENDTIGFSDMDGNTFTYKVVLYEVLNASDVEDMISSDWDMTLFTCTMDGQSRITIRCVREGK